MIASPELLASPPERRRFGLEKGRDTRANELLDLHGQDFGPIRLLVQKLQIRRSSDEMRSATNIIRIRPA
jgi:hypothetical protein